jgi:hypothetical protein
MSEIAYILTIIFLICFLIVVVVTSSATKKRLRDEQRNREHELLGLLIGDGREAEKPPKHLEECLIEYFRRSIASKAIITQLYVATRPFTHEELFDAVSGATRTFASLRKSVINEVLMNNLMPSNLVTLNNGTYSLTPFGKELATKLVH